MLNLNVCAVIVTLNICMQNNFTLLLILHYAMHCAVIICFASLPPYCCNHIITIYYCLSTNTLHLFITSII